MTMLSTIQEEKRLASDRAETTHSLSILLCFHNQVHTITSFIDRLLSAPLTSPFELVIVDDGSTDGSAELISELVRTRPSIRSICHKQTLGRAESLLRATNEMTGEIAVLLDPEKGFNPMDLPRLLRPIAEDVADVAFGSRFLSTDCRKVSGSRRTFLARLATRLSNFINGIDQTDIQPHGILIRKEILASIPLKEKGPWIETELVTKLAKWNLRLVEVAVSQDSWTQSVSCRFGVGDFLRKVGLTLKYRYLDPCTMDSTSLSAWATPPNSTAGLSARSRPTWASGFWKPVQELGILPSCSVTTNRWPASITTLCTSTGSANDLVT
jgi:hypothetical protein